MDDNSENKKIISLSNDHDGQQQQQTEKSIKPQSSSSSSSSLSSLTFKMSKDMNEFTFPKQSMNEDKLADTNNAQTSSSSMMTTNMDKNSSKQTTQATITKTKTKSIKSALFYSAKIKRKSSIPSSSTTSTTTSKTRHTSIENVSSSNMIGSGSSSGGGGVGLPQTPPSIFIYPANSPEEYQYHELNLLNVQQQQSTTTKIMTTDNVGHRRASVTSSSQMTSTAAAVLDSSNVSNISDTNRQQQQTTLSLNPTGKRRKSWDQKVTRPIRRASQALINLANVSGVLTTGSDNVTTLSSTLFGYNYGQCSRRDSRSRLQEIILMCSSFQRLPMKDFGAEVRASMDVDQFLQQAVLLLDITETSLEGIVDRMLRKVCIIIIIFLL